jgi:hypothetical protein
LDKTDLSGLQGCQAGDKKFTTCTITIVYDKKTSNGTLTVTGQNKDDKEPTTLLTSNVVDGTGVEEARQYSNGRHAVGLSNLRGAGGSVSSDPLSTRHPERCENDAYGSHNNVVTAVENGDESA